MLRAYEIGYVNAVAANPGINGTYSGDAWGSYGDVEPTFTAANVESEVAPNGDQADLNAVHAHHYFGQQQFVNSEVLHEFDSESGPLNVPFFGPGQSTTAFWIWWYSQGADYLGLGVGPGGNWTIDTTGEETNRTTNIFIDAAPAAHNYKFVHPSSYNTWGNSAFTTNLMPWLGHGESEISNTFKPPNTVLPLGGPANNAFVTLMITENTHGSIHGPNDGWWLYHGGGALYYGIYPSYEFPENSINAHSDNWRPAGFSTGAIDTNNTEYGDNLGQITFSSMGYEDSFAPGFDSIFKAQIQAPGTLFRFAQDPNQVVYEIIEIEQDFSGWGPVAGEGTEESPFTGLVNINARNFGQGVGSLAEPFEATDNSSFPELNKRHSIITRFARVNNTGGIIIGSGIDVSTWDPRGELKHNGMGSITIEILERMNDETLSDESLLIDSACWETEPKEDVDIDLYYEASSAIPIKLQKNNIQLFTKSSNNEDQASKVKTKRVFTDQTTQTIISGGAWVNDNIGDDGVRIKYSIGNLSYDAVGTIAIDDEIGFMQLNGTTTRSKILDHYTITEYSGVNVPIPTTRTTITTSFNSGVTNIVLSSVAGISVGDEIIGDGIEKGTFITSINVSFAIASIDLTSATISAQNTVTLQFVPTTGWFKIDDQVWQYPIELGWFNCYSFGNGVESDRIRDDFNAPQIDNGIKVSTTFLEYGEEKIGSGLIHSGLYNSTSSVNDLNEFNMAEKIIKNLNPSYGSIQALKTRYDALIVFTEDKVLKVLANKDAIFNADGNAQLVATHKVLGNATPYVGDYGISKNPESLASDQFRMYFTDKQRGAVLRLSRDGLTPISNVGMKSYFRERLKLCDTMLGTFDIVNGEYNVTLAVSPENQVAAITCPDTGCVETPAIEPITVSFNEGGKGWVSFKSFVPLAGESINGKYLTANTYKIWEHYSDNADRNAFYNNDPVDSEIEIVFNDSPGSIKSFKTVNYEGSQAKINKSTTETVDGVTYNDGEYYNLIQKQGWYVDLFSTDLQDGKVPEFINKENKWFNKINGIQTAIGNLDENEFSVQGIGFPLESPTDTQTDGLLELNSLSAIITFNDPWIQCTASGGSGSYNFLWSTPGAGTDFNTAGIPGGDNMSQISTYSWGAGDYQCQVIDILYPAFPDSSVYSEVFTSAALSVSLSSNELSNGWFTIYASITGGVPNYSTSWTANNNYPISNEDGSASALVVESGTYTVTVTDASGNTASAEITIIIE